MSFYCDFCGATEGSFVAGGMVGRSTVHICESCTDRCRKVISEGKAGATPAIRATTAIERAVAHFGNRPSLLARFLDNGVLRQHVEHWVKSGSVPVKHVRALSDVTGIPCWEFCPDDWWRIWPDLIGRPGAPQLPKAPEPATQE